MIEKVSDTPLDLKYTICFCRVNGKVLMVYRYREPNKDLWNGLGGKLEPGEKAKESVIREMKEEADIDISKAKDLFFAGIVTWNKDDARVGMYAFVADLPDDFLIWNKERETPEGLLAWKDEAWGGDVKNKGNSGCHPVEKKKA